jgi:glycosyltransferase involved in cell wall biosynthesis
LDERVGDGMEDRAPRCAVIITHNRPELLRQTVRAIAHQVDEIFILDNASSPPVDLENLEFGVTAVSILYVPTQPPNLAELWEEGLSQAESIGGRYVAFLCDDSPPPEAWYDTVVQAMRQTGAVIGCSGGTQYEVKTAPDHDIMNRMPGWAFVLDAKSGVRPDTSMAWWWLDTDIDFQARGAGGMVHIPGFYVHNIHPNEYTYSKPWAAERIGLDAQAFEAKWGPRPW